MTRVLKLLALLLPTFFVVGMSYTFRFDCKISVAGDSIVGANALEKVIARNRAMSTNPENRYARPGKEDNWVRIDNNVGLSLSNSDGVVYLKCYILTASGCSRSRYERQVIELLEKLVAQASEESGIEMRILEIRDVKAGNRNIYTPSTATDGAAR